MASDISPALVYVTLNHLKTPQNVCDPSVEPEGSWLRHRSTTGLKLHKHTAPSYQEASE